MRVASTVQGTWKAATLVSARTQLAAVSVALTTACCIDKALATTPAASSFISRRRWRSHQRPVIMDPPFWKSETD